MLGLNQHSPNDFSATHSMDEPSDIWVFKICLRHPWITPSTHMPHPGQVWYQGSPALGTDVPNENPICCREADLKHSLKISVH